MASQRQLEKKAEIIGILIWIVVGIVCLIIFGSLTESGARF